MASEILVRQPKLILHFADTANHPDETGQVHLRWRPTIDWRRRVDGKVKDLVVRVRYERALEGVAEVLFRALFVDASLRRLGTLHELRAHGDVALGVVDDPQDQCLEIRGPPVMTSSRGLSGRAPRTSARLPV